jgi:hypothetical protein
MRMVGIPLRCVVAWNHMALFACIVWALTLVLAVDAATGAKLMYHDPPMVFSIGFIGLALFQSVFWASPILMNEIARTLRNKYWPKPPPEAN